MYRYVIHIVDGQELLKNGAFSVLVRRVHHNLRVFLEPMEIFPLS